MKESTQLMQSEHAKASRKLENKVSDMKKMIKELRQKLTDKEGQCTQLEVGNNVHQNSIILWFVILKLRRF